LVFLLFNKKRVYFASFLKLTKPALPFKVVRQELHHKEAT
jgi:hypothetical protein